MDDFHVTYPRFIPVRRAEGFKPPATRLSLRWPRPVPYLIADWFGIQGVHPDSMQSRRFTNRLRDTFKRGPQPDAVEVMACPVDEAGLPSVVLVAYWTSATDHEIWSAEPKWQEWWNSEDRLTDGPGYWRETLMCPYDRHETVLSHASYRIGLGRTRDVEVGQMTDYGYFGAARDRIPASAIDTLDSPLGIEVTRDDFEPLGRRVVVLTPLNTTVIRSGQYWEDSQPEQATDYETELQPRLERGMEYLARDSGSGCAFLRSLVSMDSAGAPLRETSIYAVFQSFAGLERWTAEHATHRAIFDYQIAKAHQYGTHRDVKTWHEAFVLPANNVFEYINCARGTGMTSIPAAHRRITTPVTT
jgi:aldoxime dehydratase